MSRWTISQLSRTVLLTLLGCLVAAAPGGAGQIGPTTYQCTIDVAGSWDDCTEGIVTLTTSSGIYRVARVDLSAVYVRLDAFVDVCNPTDWWIHFADSPSCNGGGGDGSDSEHDAEAYLLGTKFEMLGNYSTERSALEPISRSEAGIPATGCSRVQWTIYEDRVFYDDDGDPSDTPRLEVRSIFGFESSPYDEPDAEDASGADADLWYVGINRTVGDASRSGTGTSELCLVLSTTVAPDAATLNTLCP